MKRTERVKIINNIFLSHKFSILLREKKFNELCFGYYEEEYYNDDEFHFFVKPSNDNCFGVDVLAPTYDQVQDWLEQVHGLGIETALDETLSWVWRITPLHAQATYQQQIQSPNVYCKGRKESLIAAIEEVLKHI